MDVLAIVVPARRLLENELNVLSDSYDALVAKDPSTPQIFFAVALYNENQAVYKSVRATAPAHLSVCLLLVCACVCAERGPASRHEPSTGVCACLRCDGTLARAQLLRHLLLLLLLHDGAGC